MAEHDDGPECDLCGKTTCPDADLPGFTAPEACAYAPIYEALRYDRCEYGCGRDITIQSIRRDIVPTVEAMLLAAPVSSVPQGTEVEEWGVLHAASGAVVFKPIPTEERARASAGDWPVVRRTRTRYADTVTPWVPVDAEGSED